VRTRTRWAGFSEKLQYLCVILVMRILRTVCPRTTQKLSIFDVSSRALHYLVPTREWKCPQLEVRLLLSAKQATDLRPRKQEPQREHDLVNVLYVARKRESVCMTRRRRVTQTIALNFILILPAFILMKIYHFPWYSWLSIFFAISMIAQIILEAFDRA
jgi:hypothetical protein